MARRTDGGVRFRPVGSSRHPRTPVRYSPGGTGCPAIEQAIERAGGCIMGRTRRASGP